MKSVKMLYACLSLSLLFLISGVAKGKEAVEEEITVVEVEKEKVPEIIEGLHTKKMLEKLYQTETDAVRMERTLLTKPSVSKGIGIWADSIFSKFYIRKFLEDYPRIKSGCTHFLDPKGNPITSVEDLKTKYGTFNKFFYRELSDAGKRERPIDKNPNVVVSPADCHLFVIPKLTKNPKFFVKECKFDLEKFLVEPRLAKAYENGTLMLFRLAPDDYHRFHCPFDCTPTAPVKIKGKLLSVDPIAYTPTIQPLTENVRHLITLKSAVFGDVLLVIVGATGVGGIKETCVPGVEVKKGAELGYFYFGASSLVLIFKKEVVEVEKRFVKKSAKLLDWKDTLGKYGKGESVDYPESKVKMGQRVAIKKEPPKPVEKEVTTRAQ